MQNLPNIKLTEQELKMILERKLNYGGESYICLGSNYDTLYKLFRNPRLCGTELYDGTYIPDVTELIKMSDNKFQKLKRLHELQLKHVVLPLSTISFNGELIGYEMVKKTNMYPIWFGILKEDEIIHYLNQIREILEYFAKHDITYGDIKERNILHSIATREIVFCDMDNVQIEEYPIDVLDYELDFYLNNGGSKKYIDAYMHSLMTLEALELCIGDLDENQKEFKAFFTKKGISIIESLIKPSEYKGEYISRYIKKRRG